jgi:small-conductance mechanosensitive channel
MFDRMKELEAILKESTFILPIIILGISVLLGIAVSQLVFSKLRKVALRVTGDSYPQVQRAFRGMPTVWGLLVGGYAAVHIITIPQSGLHLLEILFHVIGILSLTIMGARLVSGFLTLQVQKTAGTFASTSILVTTIELIVYITGFLFMLQSFGVSITPLLTALGVGGLAVALALQDTLSNLFSGINILLSKQIKMGDFIKLSTGEEGTVADMSWRSTTIKQPSDNMVVVPNQKIATAIITNYALPYAECSIVIPVSVSYDSDLEQVEKVTSAVAKEVLLDTPGAVSDFEPFIRYGNFAESSITFNVILRIKAITDQYLIRHEFIKRLHLRYRQEGIVIPYPVRTIKLQPAELLEEPTK